MKILRKILLIPLCIIGLLIAWEAVGALVNTSAAAIQTRQMRRDLLDAVPDAVIEDVETKTGNTSGTGNHVDMFSMILFRSELTPEQIMDALPDRYTWDPFDCWVGSADDVYVFFRNRPAPFRDNIAGH